VSAASLEGQNLGKYRILEPLGRGGMARVYRAYHPQLDRYVAVKVLRSDLVEEEEFLARFKREARAVAGLRHPNIVQVFDFDVRGNLYYMVMELLDGDTLAMRLNDHRARGGRMPEGEMVRVLLDVLGGLAYAHGAGMIHRDVKPANILLTRRGEAVLTDFGIAQIIGGTRYTVSGALMGTLAYMAPEQGLEGQCDARSDLYSTGIVFYEMLTGDPPFDAETPLAILMKHVNDPLPLPRQSDPTIPEAFERVVLKALSKRPVDRYQSAGEMAQALQAAAKRAKVELPARASPPLSFTTAGSPSESVAVLSGSARGEVVDIGFSTGDTDAALEQKLAEEAAAQEAVDTKPQRAEKEADRRQGAAAAARVRSAGGGEILNAIGLLVVFNLTAILIGAITGWWGIFGRGWPFELLLGGLLLATAMSASGTIWLLIPTAIVLGNGYLMAFYAITGAWRWWAFLWPLEPLLVVVTILYTIRLANDTGPAADLARGFLYRVRRPTLVLAVIISVLGMIFG
jgi:serine/threonine protein kinase